MIISFGNVSQKMIKHLLKLLTVIGILACSQVLAADYLDSPFSGLLSDRPPAYKDLSPEKLHIWKKLLHYDLNENLSQFKKGPLSSGLIDAFEKAWRICRADSPEYFTLYRGKGSVGGGN